MTIFRRIVEVLANITGYISGWLVPLMAALIIFEVFMRYIIHKPPVIADEFSAYMLVAISYLGAAYAFKEKAHIRITAFTVKLPQRVSTLLRVGTLCLGFIFSLVLILSSYFFMIASFKLHYRSSTWLNFPLQGPQMTLAIGFVLLALCQLAGLIKMVMDMKSGVYIKETLV